MAIRLVFILSMMRLVWSQRYAVGGRMEPINWNPQQNGAEHTYMQFSLHWKKEIVAWAKECIFQIKNNMYQLDQINWVAADDLRHAIGVTLGRILEIHRQQVDMYRRMKRVVDNRFTWLRPELSGTYHQIPGQNGVAEPGVGHFNPLQYNREWAKGGKKTFIDYKPHVYILALEYITKRQSDIEQLVKVLTTFTAEEEVGRYKPYMLPVGQGFWNVWTGYTTTRFMPPIGYWGRQGPENERMNEEDRRQEEEEAFKAKMREEYYKKNANKNK